jgi:hypothetical protein
MNDPIVQEVRRIRAAHSKRFNYDLSAICDDLRQIQATCGHEVVRLPAKHTSGAPMLKRAQ